ncbi:MAG TPA: gamma-glutamyltransferase [Solirubrobacteraceae bacterium]|nr:gamma-glutamyltransferase [Solirubrobacteraceae bacterium]
MRGSAGLLATAAVISALASAPAAQAAENPATAVGRDGAAATVDTLATKAAIKALERGGNAVDAAVTAAGVLGVVEPFSCGVGGGGFMLIRDRKGHVITIDGRETAPAAMTPTSFWSGGKPLSFDDARYSGMSAGVPGTPLSWERALESYGTISLRRALRPGERIARRGFAVDQVFHDQIAGNGTYFNDIPSTAALYLDAGGKPLAVGTRLRNPDLADTYERLGRLGVERGFYSGPVARAIVAASTDPPTVGDPEHPWLPGVMTLDDLRDYTAPFRAPTTISYRGLDVYGMGPPSSGGSTDGEALNILEGYRDFGRDRVLSLHRYLEASRLAYADRNAYLADPAFFPVPLRGLLSDSFAAERRALVPATAANATVPPGDPYDNGGRGEPSATVSHPNQSTTHLSVADRKGNVVSYTFTIESIGGNAIVVPGYGFLLNNELTDFNYDSTTHPNRVEGGKRPRSSMAPTIVERRGKPFLAIGSPGGSQIPTTVMQTFINRVDFGMTLPEAIAAPRVSQRNGPTSVAEPDFISSYAGRALASRYDHAFVAQAPPGEIGAVEAIEFLRGGRFLAAAEPVRRGSGSAMVVRP